MKVKESTIPNASLTNRYLPVNYIDVFACEANNHKEISPDDILISFWTDMPGWVNVLFKIRNFAVKFVGLKGDGERNTEELERCIRQGSAYGFISVPAKNENETVMLLADKHLDAYISIHIDRSESKMVISLITLVKFHNKLGNTYFFVISPFHKIIVKQMLKRAVSRLLHTIK